MNNCPYCNTPVSFPTEEDWYNCHICQGWIRLHASPGGTRRVEAGSQTGNRIITVQVPANNRTSAPRPSTPIRAVPIRPVETRAVSQRTTTPPTTTAPASQPRSAATPLPTNPGAMNLEQVRAERQRISGDVQTLDGRTQTLLAELNQYAHNPERVSALSAEMSRESQRRREMMRRDELLNAREDALVAEQNARTAQAAAQRMSASSSGVGESPQIGCGISAFLGMASMLGFTLYAGIQKWDVKTVLIMLGVGVGIAFAGWLAGTLSK